MAFVDEKKVMPYDDFGFFIPSIILRFPWGKRGEKFHHLEIKGSQKINKIIIYIYIYIEGCLKIFYFQFFF
jgi:hypothetical protein